MSDNYHRWAMPGDASMSIDYADDHVEVTVGIGNTDGRGGTNFNYFVLVESNEVRTLIAMLQAAIGEDNA
jgi:hypothetical protein